MQISMSVFTLKQVCILLMTCDDDMSVYTRVGGNKHSIPTSGRSHIGNQWKVFVCVFVVTCGEAFVFHL